MIYEIHYGNNLISYPLPVDGSIDDVLPDDIEDCIDAIIGEGESAVNTGNGWQGSLTVLGTDKGYWFTSLCDIDFTFDDFSIKVWVKTALTKKQSILFKGDGDGVWESGEKSLWIEGVGYPWFEGFYNEYIPGTGLKSASFWCIIGF